MILSRIIHHLRTQNWTAIAIEFLIVILGVVIGFQVTAWNEARTEEARGQGYLERIHADLDDDIANYEDRIAFWGVVSDYGLSALASASHAATGDSSTGDAGRDDWGIIVDFFQASQVGEFDPTEITYTEITSAGELGLIHNPQIRARISAYYAMGSNAALSERPDYRVTVRGIIPISLQLYIWENCYGSEGDGTQSLLACAAPPGARGMAPIADTLLADTALHAELSYWISILWVAGAIGEDALTNARDIQAMIETELGYVP
tara:strand:- start:1080 stop:1868 length:789 start_codon:yes stop_codon:yes gene_type:complete